MDRQVDDYSLDRVIGSGSTGVVWLARNSAHEEYAIKIISYATESPRFKTILFDKHLYLARLDRDPHLVKIYNVVRTDDDLAIIMEYIQGPSLRHELQRLGTFPPGTSLAILRGVLNGVSALHAHGVIHGDLKPENILLEQADAERSKIVDYGTAQLIFAEIDRTTSINGTIAYMSPEILNGVRTSAASDVYSAGIVLYELLCGVTPFASQTPVKILDGHLNWSPARPHGLDDRLWNLVASMLNKDPGDRPNAVDAAALCSDLIPILSSTPTLAPLASPPVGDSLMSRLPLPRELQGLSKLPVRAGPDTVRLATRLTENRRMFRRGSELTLSIALAMLLVSLMAVPGYILLGREAPRLGWLILGPAGTAAGTALIASLAFGAIKIVSLRRGNRRKKGSALGVATRYRAAYLRALERRLSSQPFEQLSRD